MATNRLSFVLVGLRAVRARRVVLRARHVGHVHDRVDIWLRPVRPALYDKPAAATRSRSRCSRRPTAGCSGRASASRCCTCRTAAPILPAPHTDLIYAVIINELGLAGACGLLLVYLLFVARGFKTAMLARDSFSKLLATGLTAVFALQVFVIVGGVTRVIPLTGVTLPFVSYGGSSIVANFVLLALLLLVSDRARRRPRRGSGAGEHARRPPLRPRRRAVRACWSASRRAGRCSTPRRCATTRPTAAMLLAGAAHQARHRSAPPTARCSPRSAPEPGRRATRRRYPHGDLFAHPVGYSFIDDRPRRARATPTTTS